MKSHLTITLFPRITKVTSRISQICPKFAISISEHEHDLNMTKVNRSMIQKAITIGNMRCIFLKLFASNMAPVICCYISVHLKVREVADIRLLKLRDLLSFQMNQVSFALRDICQAARNQSLRHAQMRTRNAPHNCTTSRTCTNARSFAYLCALLL